MVLFYHSKQERGVIMKAKLFLSVLEILIVLSFLMSGAIIVITGFYVYYFPDNSIRSLLPFVSGLLLSLILGVCLSLLKDALLDREKINKFLTKATPANCKERD